MPVRPVPRPRARQRPRRAGVVAAALTALVGSGTAVTSAAAAPAQGTSGVTGTTVLTGQVLRDLHDARYADLGAVAAGAPMRVAVQADVHKALSAAAATAILSDKSSPRYHQYLTPEQYQAQFGLDAASAANIRQAVTGRGLRVVYASADGSYLELVGTAGQVNDTFQVTEHTYRGVVAEVGGAAQTFTANDTAPTVPAGVTAVAGLTSLTTKHTAQATSQATSRVASRAATSAAGPPAAAPAQNGCVAGRCTGTLKPADLWSVYNQPATDTGQGQKVAIFGEGQVDPVIKDLRGFEAAEQLPDGSAFPQVPTRKVLVGDDQVDNAGLGEWNLDSDAVTGMSPNLQELDYYFGSDLSDASIGGTYSAWADESASTAPMTGNSSFGGAEALEYTGGFILDAPLRKAAMEGRTMFVSSGDGGGSCLPGANGVTNDAVPCVEYPASSTYATGVGGTVLYTSTTTATGGTQATPATRNLEYSWTYSGGGMSTFEAAPAYQTAVYPAGMSPVCTGTNTGQSCRGVPDVSAVSGDVLTNQYEIYSGGALTSSGGTSLSSPLWAGMWARVQAAHTPTCSKPTNGTVAGASVTGFAQAVLYGLASTSDAEDAADFFDVGGTTNSQPSGNLQQMALPRVPTANPKGYDFVSGLGTPNVGSIIGSVDCSATATTVNTVPDQLDSSYSPSQPACGTNGVLNGGDKSGDTVPPMQTALDITAARITSDPAAATTTFATTVTNLAGVPATNTDYEFDFGYAGVRYGVAADRSAVNAFTLYRRNITTDANTGQNAETAPTALSTSLTGTFDTTSNTVSVVMPWSLFNTAAVPATPYGAGAVLSGLTIYTANGTYMDGAVAAYQGAPVDQAEYFECTYMIAAVSTPSADLPEAPYAALLLLALPASWAVIARRRRAPR